MSNEFHTKTFPGESAAYRAARNDLLKAELELDEAVQKTAELRKALPDGGPVPEDYAFEGISEDGSVVTRQLSELFEPGKSTLFVYSFMLAPDATSPCPACTSLVDGFSGISQHINDRINIAIVAKAPITKLAALANERNWYGLPLLSSHNNTYNEDYFAVGASGAQIPAANIFVKREDGIRHFWSAELLYVDRPNHPRHVDQLWPIWNILDLTPEGRGADWFPKLAY